MNRLILGIETTGEVCSVSILVNGVCNAFRSSLRVNSHAEVLTVFIGDLCKDLGISLNELSAVAISRGPGSYTGLRIGTSVAKGICYACDIPLISVCSHRLMIDNPEVRKYVSDHPVSFIAPMVDARRMEVYAGVFDSLGSECLPISNYILDQEDSKVLFERQPLLVCGSGAEKVKSLTNNSSFILQGVRPDAANMGRLALESYELKQFEDVAYFEPFYLKPFHATSPKKLI